MRKVIPHIAATLALALSSCTFTGVESTPKITDKEVGNIVRVTPEEVKAQAVVDFNREPFDKWVAGKQFYVTDNNIRRIFSSSPLYSLDTLKLAHKTLTYMGYTTGGVLDNRALLNLRFSDGTHTYEYPTKKELEEISDNFEVPFLIDLDLVKMVKDRICGETYYVRTASWIDASGNQIHGRKYVKVRIDAVMPGNNVYPIMLRFTDLEKEKYAFLWMTAGKTPIKNRSFDALFSLTDIRAKYSHISDEVWECIVDGRVKQLMTKEECRLAWGTPKAMRSVPTYTGVREFWDYDNGRYLRFDDGLLEVIR